MGPAGRRILAKPLGQPQRLLGCVDREHVVAGVHVEGGGLLVEADELEAGRTVLQQVDPALVVLDRALAVSLVPERRADLSMQVANTLEVLLAAVMVQALLPDLRRLVHATEAQGDVAELLRHPRAGVGVEVAPQREGLLVVAERLLVRVEGRGVVAGRLERLQRPRTDLLELALLDPGVKPQLRCTPVMVGDHRDDSLGAVGRARRDELTHLGVPAGAHGLRQGRVGHVADQHVLERVLVLTREAAACRGHDQVLVLERAERLHEVASLAEGEERALPEGVPHDRRVLEHRAFVHAQRVEPGREYGVDGLRQRLGVGRALLHDPVHHLLGEEGIATRTLGDLAHELRVAVAAFAIGEERADQLPRPR